MGFAFFCVGTIIISFILDFKNGLRMYKDLADEGYKIDSVKFKGIQDEIMPDALKENTLSLLIPFYNIFVVYKKTMEYNNVKNMVAESLRTIGVLDEMNKVEKEEYAKKPTGLNAIIAPIKAERRMLNARIFRIVEGPVTGEIKYEMDNNMKNITILESTGDLAKLPEEEQIKQVINGIFGSVQSKIKAKGIGKVINEAGDETVIRIKKNEEIPTEVSDEEKKIRETAINALEEMKQELLRKYSKNEEEVKEEEPSKTFTKKL